MFHVMEYFCFTLSALRPVQPRQLAQPRHFLQFNSKLMAVPLKAKYLLKYIITLLVVSGMFLSEFCYGASNSRP